jgi:Rap1a immunity proteins
MLESRPTLKLYRIFLFAALIFSSGVALAEEDTTSAIYVMPGCRSLLTEDNSRTYLQGVCAGLISALFYMSVDRCPPAGVTRGKINHVVVQYIASRPARMQEDFKDLALEAIRAAWPCKR